MLREEIKIETSNAMFVSGYNAISSVLNCYVYGLEDSVIASGYPMITNIEEKAVGESDIKRVKKLGNTKMGEGHDNFLNGIIVQFDLKFSNKAWVELQRYHFIDFVSSQSTMHKISHFDLDNQYNEYVDNRIVEIMTELKETYNKTKNKEDYLRLLYSNPSGFMLTAKMTTNYRQLKTIYNQRHNHRLPEWQEFCKWLLTLPMFEEICLGGANKD